MSTVTNIIVLAGAFLLMLAEYIISKLFMFPYNTLYLSTIIFYIIFLCIQALYKIYKDVKKNTINLIIKEIIQKNNEIPIINKNNKIVIKWDIIFKKLIENKELNLYEKILKVKPYIIDYYINAFPALLLDNNTDIIENNHKVDLNSVVKNNYIVDKDNINDSYANETTNKLLKEIFLKEISSDKAVFCNYDKSIYVNVLLINEDIDNSDDILETSKNVIYDGFSIQAYFNDEKYMLVPKIVLKNKKIDKEKWFYRNISILKKYIEELVHNHKIDNQFELNENDLDNYVEAINPNKDEYEEFLILFNYMKGNKLYFTMLNVHNLSERLNIGCEIQTYHNNFELVLKDIVRITNDNIQRTDDIQKTIALGNSYNPIISILENMQMIVRNITLIINNKELELVIIKD